MGSPGGAAGEPERSSDETQHSITVSSFSMSKYPVTQKEYEAVMGYNPSYFQGSNLPAGVNSDNLPVEQVTWFDAVKFCNELSQNEGLEQVYTITVTSTNGDHITGATVSADWTKKGYRLPTETEWEYACRGNYANKATEYNTKPFGIGDGTKMVSGMANFYTGWPYELPGGQYYDSAEPGNLDRTSAVGSYKANNYGLYDMHGNVWEWCWDWYGTYPSDGKKDYTGASSGSDRVIRGGSWYYNAQYLRSAVRLNVDPDDRDRDLGFRVVCP